jgi:hypothetical protein
MRQSSPLKTKPVLPDRSHVFLAPSSMKTPEDLNTKHLTTGYSLGALNIGIYTIEDLDIAAFTPSRQTACVANTGTSAHSHA